MSTPVLQYSTLPARSRITAEPTLEGIAITVPPASLLRPLLALGFVILMLAPMTIDIFSEVSHIAFAHLDHDSSFFIFMSLTLLVIWTLVACILWKIITRRRIPVVCNVTKTHLILVTPERPKLRHEFKLDEFLEIQASRIGIGINLRYMGALDIRQGDSVSRALPGGGPTFRILAGRDLREIQWIANTLNESIASKVTNLPSEENRSG